MSRQQRSFNLSLMSLSCLAADCVLIQFYRVRDDKAKDAPCDVSERLSRERASHCKKRSAHAPRMSSCSLQAGPKQSLPLLKNEAIECNRSYLGLAHTHPLPNYYYYEFLLLNIYAKIRKQAHRRVDFHW